MKKEITCFSKKGTLALLILSMFTILSFTITGCGELPVDEPDFIPELAFNSDIARVVADLSSPDEYALTVYSMVGPFITGFKTNSGYAVGDEYYVPFLNTELNVTIKSLGDGEYHFEGELADGTGSINVYYSMSEKTFSFDQVFYVDADGQFEIISYSGGSDISVDGNGYFHGFYESSYVGHYPADSAEGIPERYDLSSGSFEIYRGEMNSSGDVGTGLVYYGDGDTDPNTGTRFYTSYETFDPSAVTEAPDTVSATELSGWKTYLSSSAVESLDIDDLAAWQIFYKFDSHTSPKTFSYYDLDPAPAYNIDSLLAAFTTNPNSDDMSIWGSESLIVAAMQ